MVLVLYSGGVTLELAPVIVNVSEQEGKAKKKHKTKNKHADLVVRFQTAAADMREE